MAGCIFYVIEGGNEMANLDPQVATGTSWHIIAAVIGGLFSLLGLLFNWFGNRQRKIEKDLEDSQRNEEKVYRENINTSIRTIWLKHDQLVDEVKDITSQIDKLEGFCKATHGKVEYAKNNRL
jgi:hypothetical protein